MSIISVIIYMLLVLKVSELVACTIAQCVSPVSSVFSHFMKRWFNVPHAVSLPVLSCGRRAEFCSASPSSQWPSHAKRKHIDISTTVQSM